MTIIKNIGELVGIVPEGVLRKQGAEMAETGVLRDAWLAIELFNAAQALEFRRPAKSSPILEHIFEDYRKEVPFIDNDTYMHPLIEESIRFIRQEQYL